MYEKDQKCIGLMVQLNMSISCYTALTLFIVADTIRLLTLSAKSLFYLVNKMSGLLSFLKEAWVELKKVVWPSKNKTVRLTAAVLAVTFAVAGFIALIDLVFNKVLTFLIER